MQFCCCGACWLVFGGACWLVFGGACRVTDAEKQY